MTAAQLKTNIELWMKNNPSKSSPVALVELASAMSLNEVEALNHIEAIRLKYQIPLDVWK